MQSTAVVVVGVAIARRGVVKMKILVESWRKFINENELAAWEKLKLASKKDGRTRLDTSNRVDKTITALIRLSDALLGVDHDSTEGSLILGRRDLNRIRAKLNDIDGMVQVLEQRLEEEG